MMDGDRSKPLIDNLFGMLVGPVLKN